jgi:hypothetical protein
MSVTDDELDKLEQQIEAKAAEAPKAPEPAPEREQDPTPEPPPAAAASEPPGSEPAPFDSSEWVKKKGWRTPEDAAKSMRELEQAFHKQAEELRRSKEQQPPFQPGWPTPPNGYQPPTPAFAPPQPQYAPPQNPYAPQAPWGPPAQRPNEEQVAASYGMTVEDFRRVLAVSKDIAAVQAQAIQADMNAWRAKTELENEKANDLQKVMTDPAFHNLDVQYEMHDVLEKNAEIWSGRRAYSTALNQALVNLARKQLGGGQRPPGSTLPTEPPKTGGHAGGGLPGKRGIGGMPSVADMQNKSPEEIEKLLRSMNAVKNYGDY